MTGQGLPIAPNLRADAEQGQWCPKMCTFACPVAAATGRDDAVPWSFHREVADLAAGRQRAEDVRHRLDLCNGCGACGRACTYDQDIPAQVVAARAAVLDAGVASRPVLAAVRAVADGRSPFHDDPLPVGTPGAAGATVVVLGCRDAVEAVDALQRIAEATGQDVRIVVPDGCCGGVLRDLGATSAADASGTLLHAKIDGARTIVGLDANCLTSLGEGAIDVATWLHRLRGGGSLSLSGNLGPIAVHDPPALTSRPGYVGAVRGLLRAMGATIVESEGHAPGSASAGPGLGMELLDPDAAAAVAHRRATQLAATGARVVTVGAPDHQALRATGLRAADLLGLVARCLPGAGDALLPDAGQDGDMVLDTPEPSLPEAPQSPSLSGPDHGPADAT